MKRSIFEKYAKAVSIKFSITLEEMYTKDNHENVVDARYFLYYLCVERPIKISHISQFMLDNGLKVYRTTIKYGYNKAKKMIDSDSDYKRLVQEITNE